MTFFSKGGKKQKPTLLGGKTAKNIDWLALPKLLTIKQVCEILSVHPNTLRNWDDSGRLKAIRVGARKDRRYEKEAIQKICLLEQPIQPAQPASKLPEPIDGGKYVLKPGWSAAKIKLLLISKKFSLFVYSIAAVAFAFFIIQTFFFAHIFIVRAEATQAQPRLLTLEPNIATGWANPNQAKHLDVLSTGDTASFTDKNSATYTNRPVVVKGEATDAPALAEGPAVDMPTEEPTVVPPADAPPSPAPAPAAEAEAASLDQSSPNLELSGFQLPGEISGDSLLNSAAVVISFGGDSFPNNEDVVTFSYSLDAGAAWQTLDSFALSAKVSNATHNGYWEFPLTEKIGTIRNLEKLRIKINYNAVPGPQTATAYVDGANLRVTLIEPPSEKTVDKIDQSVALNKKTFSAKETPTLDVAVEEKSKLAFLGAASTKRQVKSVTLTDPAGRQKKVDAAIASTTADGVTTAAYAINPDALSAPGQYTVTTSIEQNGYTKDVTETFIWGALAMNPDQSLYKKGDTAVFSIGALDEHGGIVCDADVTLTITDPAGKKTVKRTADQTIEVTDFCGKKELYLKQDMVAREKLARSGTYSLDLAATVRGNTSTLTDTLIVEDQPAYTINRAGPTRVFPNIYQPMKLEVTVRDDFKGTIQEAFPADFDIRPEHGGYNQPYFNGTEVVRLIAWNVDLKAGSTVTLGYTFKSPEKSPALYTLGPAQVGDWQEHRAWQLVIDPAYMYLLATSGTDPDGWTNQTTYDGASARFLRGAATYGGTGGATTHTPTVTGATAGATTSGLAHTCVSRCNARASYAHTHTTTAPTAGSANNDPAYHSFYLWKSDAQNPTTIPQNTFLFSSASQSGSWTRFSAADSRLVKLTNSHTTGGSDTHTHAMTSWGSLAAAVGTANVALVLVTAPPSYAAASHTHTAPANSNSTSATSVPPYVQTMIYQQTNATPQPIPQNVIGMFDADPGTGWDVISDASPYLNNFVQGYSTESGTGGSATHDDTATATSGAIATSEANFTSGTDIAQDDHTHTVTATITAGSDHTPPYVNFVLAKCTNAGGCSGGTTYSVAGNVYSDEGSSLIGGTPTIRLLVNGTNTACSGGACTATVSGGAYTISNITTVSGDVLTLYLDTAGTPLATTVTVGSGSSLTGINLYQNRLIVRYETGSSITNTQILTGYGTYADTDILYYTAGSPALTAGNLTNSNIELHVWTGKTYAPGGTVTTQGTGGLHIDDSGAMTTGGTTTVAQNLTIDASGLLTVGAHNLTVSGASSITGTLTVSSATGTKSFYGDVTVNSGGTWNETAAENIAFTGNLTNNATTWTASTGVHIFAGASKTISGATATVIPSVSIQAATANTNTLTVATLLTVDSGITLTNNGTVTAATALSGLGGFTNAATGTLNIGGTSGITTLTATASGNTVNYTGAAQTVHNNAYHHLGLSGSGAKTLTDITTVAGNLTMAGTCTATTAANFTVSGNLQIDNTAALTSGGFNFTVTGTSSITGSLIFSNATGTKLLTGDVTVNTGGTLSGISDITVSGSVTGGGAVTMTGGTFTQSVASASEEFGTNVDVATNWTFYNLTLTNTYSAPSLGFACLGTGQIIVSNNFAITQTGSAMVVDNASCNRILDVGNNVTLSGAVLEFSAAPTASFTVGGSWSGGAFFTASGGTVTFDATAGSKTISNESFFYDVVFNGSGGGWSPAAELTVSHNLTVTLGTLTTAGYALTVTGTTTVNGGTLTLDNNTGTKLLTGAVAVSSGTLNGASTAIVMRGGITQSSTGSVAITGTATFNTNSQALAGTVAIATATITTVTVTNNGTFTVSTALGGTGGLTNGSGATLNINGTSGITTLTPAAAANTINYTGAGQTVHAPTTNNYYHLGLSGSGAKTLTGITSVTGNFTMAGTASATTIAGTTIGGNLTVGSGTACALTQGAGALGVTGNVSIGATATLTGASGQTLTISGNFTNSGTFTHSSGTVTLNGSAQQTVNSTTTFNNLTVTNASGTVSPWAPSVIFGAANTVSGTFTASTADSKIQFKNSVIFAAATVSLAPASSYVYLRSDTTIAWLFNVTNAPTVTRVDVSYSNASGGAAINASNGTNVDSGNTTNWTWPSATINIAGTANGNNGATVKVAVNGAAQIQTATMTSTAPNNTWSITGVTEPTAGDVVTVWVDNVTDANESTAATKFSSGNISGMALNTNILTIGSANNQSLTVTNLSQYTCSNDEDVMHSVASSVVEVEGTDAGCGANPANSYTSEGMAILASNTLTVAGASSEAVNTHDLTNAGTLTSTTTATYNVSGSWTNSATFTGATSTVNFTSTATGQTINPGASSFYNVIFNGSGGAWSPLTNTMTITNDLTMTNGTFNTATGTASVTVNGTVQCGASCGTITMNSAGTNTFTQSVSAAEAFGTNVAVATDWTFYNLTFANASGTNAITVNGTGTGQVIVANNLSTTNSGTALTLQNNTNNRIFDVGNDVSIGAGTTLQAPNTASFTVGGNWTNSGTFTANSGWVTFDSTTTGRTITDGGSDWRNVIFNGTGGGWSFADATTLAGDLTVTAGTLSGTNNITVSGGDFSGAGTVTLTGGTVTLNGTGNFSGNTAWNFNNLTFGLNGVCNGTDFQATALGTGQINVANVLSDLDCYCGETCSSVHYISAAPQGSKLWVVSGDTITPLNELHLVNVDTEDSTFRFTGDASVNVSSYSFHSLELSPATSQEYTVDVGLWGNFYVNNNATINAGSSQLAMYGNGTIDANNETFTKLLNNGNSNTVTIQNTDLTVSNYEAGLYSDLIIPASRTFSVTGSEFGLFDTVSGAGTLRFTNTSSGPGTEGTISAIVRYDATGGNVVNTTFDARTYGGDVEAYADTAAIRSIAMASGTQQINGSLKVITGASQSQVLTLDASVNPTVNATGDLTFTKGGSATPAITSGTGIWTVGGNVNFTNGTYTATAGNTLKMNGSSKSLTSASQTLQNFEVSGGSVSSADAQDVNGTFKVTSGGFTQAANANLNVADDFTLSAGTTFTKASGTGLVIFDGDLIYTDGTAVKQDIGSVEIGTSPDTTNLDSDFAASRLRVRTGDVFETDGYEVDVGSNGIQIEGTLDATTCEGAGCDSDESLITTGDEFDIQSGGQFIYDQSTVQFDGTTGTDDLITNGSGDSYALYNLTINDGGNSLTVEVEDPLVVKNDLTITGGTLDTVTGENNAINVGNNWLNSDIFTARTAPVTFDATDSGNTINPGSSSFYDVIFNGSGGAWSPLTNTMTITNDLTMTNGTFNTAAGTANVTVNGNVQCGASCGTITMNSAGTNTFTQSVSASKAFGAQVAGSTAWSFYNLTFTNTAATAPTITFNGTNTGTITVANALTMTNAGTSLAVTDAANRILDVNGDVNISTANVTFTAPASASFTVAGGWTNAGAFTHNNGTVTFDATSGPKSINPGSSAFYVLTFNGSGGTWRPATNTLTVANNLNVTAGTMDNETNDRILDVGGDVTIGGSGVLQASSTASFTVGAGWTNAGTFTANSGTVTLDAASGTRTINSTGAASASFNNLTLNDGGGPATFQLDSALDVNGSLLITGGTLDTKSGSNFAVTIAGNWTNNDTFTANSGTVTADGASQQTFSGTLTGATGKFNNLTITNASGSDPDTSPSVIFAAGAETAGTFTATTANTKLRFTATNTYTFQNISFNGQAQHTRVYLRSSAGGSAWNLNSAGTRTVKNTDVKDSYACGQPPDIDGTHVSNKNSAGNTCWDFTALTFTLSANSLNLGTLATGSVATASHTIQTVTSADSGYATYVYVDGDLLNGGNTINSATGTLSSGTEGYGIATSDASQTITQDASCGSAPYNVTALTTSQQAVAGATSGPADETSTVCYQAAIASDTVAGNYSQIVTFVTVGLF
ncbi:MAG: helix-turn-helix domain-containing protein [Patescibacteria group bacterium]